MVIGFVYDVFRIKRKTIKTTVLFIYIEDILYWIIVMAIMFALIFYSNDGEIRGFIFIGALIGVILYMLLLSKIIVKFSLAILNILGKIIKVILFIVAYPFRLIYRVLSIPVKLLMKPAKKFTRSIKAYSRIKMVKISMWKRSLRNRIKKI